jgi:hypothetical protein
MKFNRMSHDPYTTPQAREHRSGPKWLVIAFCVVLAAFMVAVGIGMVQYSRAIQARREAEMQRALSEQLSSQLAEKQQRNSNQAETQHSDTSLGEE